MVERTDVGSYAYETNGFSFKADVTFNHFDLLCDGIKL